MAYLNAVEKDLEKFVKFFVIKSTQVIVQSRLGEKLKTVCNPLATGQDWFNIVVVDHPDVYRETKRAVGNENCILRRLQQPLCIEISLKTTDGDSMVLEVWSLSHEMPPNDNFQTQIAKEKDESSRDISSEHQSLKAAHAIYNRIGILLKSLISLTRTTPAYKLSRRQSSETFGIFYRIYVGQQQQNLGEGYKIVKIGQLKTIIGVLSLQVAYRTELTIRASSAQVHTILLKSDHFPQTSADMNKSQNIESDTPKRLYTPVEKSSIDIDQPLRPGAFTDVGKLCQYGKDDLLPETPPFEWILRKYSESDFFSTDLKSSNGELLQESISINRNNNANNVKEIYQNTSSTSVPAKSLFIPISSFKQLPETSQTNDDDNLLKELNFPFASPNSHVNELAKFYRECYNAPKLHGSDLQSNAEHGDFFLTQSSAVDDLSRQLELFETSLDDYDKLVSQLGLTNSSSTESRSSGGLQMSN